MTFNSFRSILAGAVALTAMVGAAPAMAEIKEVTFANQTGLTHLPLMIMKDMHLVEKHLAAQGLEQTQVNWVTLPGSAAMTDGLLSGSVQVASAGFPGMALLWEKTGGRVKSLGAQSTASLRLVTRLEGVETVGVTSGASVPEVLVRGVLDLLGEHGYNNIEKVTTAEETLTFALPRELRPARAK